jgi:hypothetical protein
MDSASLCSLAGRYDNPIPTRFLAPINFLKITAPVPVPELGRQGQYTKGRATTVFHQFGQARDTMFKQLHLDFGVKGRIGLEYMSLSICAEFQRASLSRTVALPSFYLVRTVLCCITSLHFSNVNFCFFFRVCRKVAFDFQSNVPGDFVMHDKKQIPCITSMLTRHAEMENPLHTSF